MSPNDAAAKARWYDRLSGIYDLAPVEFYYGGARRTAVESLRLEPGNVVLDLACGTGLNFELLMEGIGPSGLVVGVDASSGMLTKARARARRHSWDASRLRLLNADARELPRESLSSALPEGRKIDRFICTLGLSVIPDWEQAFSAAFGALSTGGRCAIMDLHFDREGFWLQFTNAIASADCSRRVWEPMRRIVSDYEQVETALRRHLGGRLVVASGTKVADKAA